MRVSYNMPSNGALRWLSVLSLCLAFAACKDDVIDYDPDVNTPPDGIECDDGATRQRTCGDDGAGSQAQICADGAWADDGECKMPVSQCDDDATRQRACGENDAGTQNQVCTDGAWTNDGDCDIPANGCDEDDTRIATCGDDEEGEQPQICEQGEWIDDGECEYPNQNCEEGETREEICEERNGLKGTRVDICLDDAWEVTQECERIEATVEYATITVQNPKNAEGDPTGTGVWAAAALNGADPPTLRHFDLNNLEVHAESGQSVAIEVTEENDTFTATLRGIENDDETLSDLTVGVYTWTLNDDAGTPVAGSSFTLRSNDPADTALELSGLSLRVNERAQIALTDELGRVVEPTHHTEGEDLTRYDYVTISGQIYSYEAISDRAETAVTRGRKFSPKRQLVLLRIFDSVSMPIQVTKGAHFEVFRKVADNPVSPEHYIEFLPIDFEVDEDLSNDAYDGYRIDAPNNVLFHTEASIPGQTVKHAEMFKITVTPDEVKVIDLQDFDDTMVGDNGYKEADILTNVQDNHVVSLALDGQSPQHFELDIFRVWQAMKGDASNYFIDPNYILHTYGDAAQATYQNIPGRAQALIEALQPGVSVITLGYEPVHVFDTFSFLMWGNEPYPPGQTDEHDFFNAIEPARLGVVIVQVGEENTDEIEMNIDTTVFDTFYFPREEGHASFTFTPIANNDLEVCVHTPLHRSQWNTDWHCFDANDDDSYTIELTDGRNIVRAKTENSEQFFVLRARPVDISIEHADDPSAPIRVGDPVRVQIDGLSTPLPKLSNVYNPGFPNTTFVKYFFEGTEILGEKTQYAIAIHGVIELDGFDEAGVYTLENGRIHSAHLGQRAGAHRGISRGGSHGGYTGGDASIGPHYSFLPELRIEVLD